MRTSVRWRPPSDARTRKFRHYLDIVLRRTTTFSTSSYGLRSAGDVSCAPCGRVVGGAFFYFYRMVSARTARFRPLHSRYAYGVSVHRGQSTLFKAILVYSACRATHLTETRPLLPREMHHQRSGADVRGVYGPAASPSPHERTKATRKASPLTQASRAAHALRRRGLSARTCGRVGAQIRSLGRATGWLVGG